MSVTISGTNGIDKVAANSVESGDIQAGAVSQTNLASNVAGNGPVLRAAGGYTNSVSGSTTTTLTGLVASIDTASCFNASNSRWTPNVAGYYQVTTYADFGSNGVLASVSLSATIIKNGSPYSVSGCGTSSNTYPTVSCTDIVYMNGTTDYVAPAVYQNSGSTAGAVRGLISGCLVRAA